MKLSSDVEENSGPKPSSCQSFPICHWNLNSISAHNYMKLSLLRVYLSTHKFDVICISESYLNSDASTIDENLEIAGLLSLEPITHLILSEVVFAFPTNTLFLSSY